MLIAFRNTAIDKPTILAQLSAHAKADEIIKGQYWKDGKGCAVGCTIHSGNHAEYERRFGVPQMLASRACRTAKPRHGLSDSWRR
jgi:hypothetical protein